jgi:hypothetical protein
MDWWAEFQIKQDEYQAEAVRRRLLALAEEAQRRGPSPADRALAAIGRRMSSWGERLEKRAPRPRTRREALA